MTMKMSEIKQQALTLAKVYMDEGIEGYRALITAMVGDARCKWTAKHGPDSGDDPELQSRIKTYLAELRPLTAYYVKQAGGELPHASEVN